MPNYDGIKTSFQLGDDLQVGPVVAGGANIRFLGPFGDYPFFRDFDFGGGDSVVAICKHQGSIFAAFIESDWDGVTTYTSSEDGYVKPNNLYLAKGPYVKRYDPGSNAWLLVGDPIEPTLTPTLDDPFLVAFDWRDSNGVDFGGSNSFAIGTRFLPSRVQLASDGDSLYLAYALHVTVPFNSDVYSPFELIVRQFDGSTWNLFGEIAAIGQNDDQGTNVINTEAAFSGISLVASPFDPGACYVTLVQCGRAPTNVWTYEGVAIRYSAGTGTGGDVHTIGTPRTATYGVGDKTDGTLFEALEMRYDDVNGPWIFWEGFETVGGAAGPDKTNMQRWSDMTIVRSVRGSRHQVNSYGLPLAYEGDTLLLVYRFQDSPSAIAYLREMASDGSADPGPLDSIPTEVPLPSDPDAAAMSLVPEPPNNIWGIDKGHGGLQVWLYHRHCRAWTHILFAPTSLDPISVIDPGSLSGFQFDADYRLSGGSYVADWIVAQTGGTGGIGMDYIVKDGVIYVVAALNSLVDLRNKVAVYAAPIARNIYGCNAETQRHVYTAPYYIPLGNESGKS